MATFNSANGHYQSGNKTLFEAQMLATSDGVVIGPSNPLPVNIGGANLSFGNVNISFPPTQNVSFSNQSVTFSGNIAGIDSTITVANGYQTTQNVSFNDQSITVTGNVAGIDSTVIVDFVAPIDISSIINTVNVAYVTAPDINSIFDTVNVQLVTSPDISSVLTTVNVAFTSAPDINNVLNTVNTSVIGTVNTYIDGGTVIVSTACSAPIDVNMSGNIAGIDSTITIANGYQTTQNVVFETAQDINSVLNTVNVAINSSLTIDSAVSVNTYVTGGTIQVDGDGHVNTYIVGVDSGINFNTIITGIDPSAYPSGLPVIGAVNANVVIDITQFPSGLPVNGSVTVTDITLSVPLSVSVSGNVAGIDGVITVANGYQTTQNVEFNDQSVTITGNIAGIDSTVNTSIIGTVNTYIDGGTVTISTACSSPIDVSVSGNVAGIDSTITIANGYQTTQNVSFNDQSVTITGNIAGIDSTITTAINHSNGAWITTGDPLPVTATINHSNGAWITTGDPLSVSVSGNVAGIDGVITVANGYQTTQNVYITASSLTVNTAPWEIQVARGLITGVNIVEFNGSSPSVGASFKPLWGNTDIFFAGETNWHVFDVTSADHIVLVSDDAGDDGYVSIEGIASDWSIANEVIQLDGISSVATIGTYKRINKITIINAVNAGTITAVHVDSNILMAQIEPGVATSTHSWYTVPLGKRLVLSKLSTSGAVSVRTKSKNNNVSTLLKLNDAYTSDVSIDYNNLKVFTEKTDIVWEATSTDIPVSMFAIGLLIND